MNKKLFTTLPIAAFLIFQNINVSAQTKQNVYHNTDGSVSMITFKNGTPKNSIINSKGNSTNLNKLLNISNDIELRLRKTEFGFQNFVTEYYDTYYNGYKIDGGEYRVNYKANDIISISGRTFSVENLNSNQNVISEQEAFNKALNNVNAKTYAWEEKSSNPSFDIKKPKGELVYLPIQQSEDKYALILSYKFDVYALVPLSRDYIFIDAATGLLLKKSPIIKHAEGRINLHNDKKSESKQLKNTSYLDTGNAETRYSGTREIQAELDPKKEGFYRLFDTSRGIEIITLNLNGLGDTSNLTEFNDNDNNWTAAEFKNTNKDDVALDAHWGVTKTYDYFKQTFNRDSYDNKKAPLYSFIHYSKNYENAYWSGNAMVYGDGNGIETDPLTALDITAHELGHAVSQETAGLDYERESGALNEAFSDIWSATVKHKFAPEKQPFILGGEIFIKGNDYLRSMSDPKSRENPDTYKGEYWFKTSVDDGCLVPDSETNDGCGVHYNSGVLNHWFYILVMGKNATNDLGHAYDVTGIGFEDAEKIVYRLETAYLSPKSDYKNTRDFGIQAAIDLFGADSPQAIATQNSFYAVGLGGKYITNTDTKVPSTPANLVAKNTTGNATTLNWDAATDENGIWGYIIMQDDKEVGRTPNATFRLNNLKPLTSYKFDVIAYDNYNNESSKSNSANITTTNLAAPCDVSSGFINYFSISNVKLNTINNPSISVKGYEDFSYLNTELVAGQSYNLDITPSILTGYNSIKLSYAVFLDNDNDGVFNATKRLANVTAAGSNVLSIPITIPETATTDQPLRLRIIQMYNPNNTNITGCAQFVYGEVEDYSVTVKANLATDDLISKSVKIYPNPVNDILNVELLNNKEFKFEIINTAGSVVKLGTSKKTINVTSLGVGVYILKITQDGTETVQKFIKK